MDIRGTGNIVGEEQSGQIKDVGVGLYHHMLEEALKEIQDNPDVKSLSKQEWTPQINLGLKVLIPEAYIKDEVLRFSLYKRVSDLHSSTEIDEFEFEMLDRFGPLPDEFKNLLSTIILRNLCKELHIQKIDAGPKGILVSFYKDTVKNPDQLLEFIQKSAGTIKARPDQKLVILKRWGSPVEKIRGLTTLFSDLMSSLKK